MDEKVLDGMEEGRDYFKIAPTEPEYRVKTPSDQRTTDMHEAAKTMHKVCLDDVKACG